MRQRSRSRLVVFFLIVVLFTLNVVGIAYADAGSRYRTDNVFLVVMDGVRYSETFGDSTHQYIPHLWNDLKPLGTMYSNFRNDFITVTVPGHTSMLTGAWQKVKNDATERPHQPTVFEYFRKQTGTSMSKTWVVVQHMNLISTDFSDHPDYGKPYRANLDSPGLHKKGELKQRGDFGTWEILQAVMDRDHPQLVMVNFGMTDSMGHSGNWSAYTNAIRDADGLIRQLWQKIQSDQVYKDKTTMFIVNDHGRHLDGVKTGFEGHGDNCEGCQHVMMLAIGPDIKVNTISDITRQLIDIGPTIGTLMEFETPLAKGNVLSEMPMERREQGTVLATRLIAIAAMATVAGSLILLTILRRSRNQTKMAGSATIRNAVQTNSS